MSRGQLTFETMVAVVILLIFFIGSMSVLIQVNWSSENLKTNASEWNECSRISGLIQEVFVQGYGTQIIIQSGTGLEVSSSAVLIGNTSCNFAASVQPVSLTAGNIIISNYSGTVVLQNE